ncbi:MAG: hypothetical protein HFG33_02980 [Bacilli bacterium]|nr:hypothetical protein [Bacilli bacterium]
MLGLCAITIVLASTLGTYAYFMTNLGREEKQELTVTTGTLALIFEDNSDGINATLSLRESVTKEFKIRNTGTLDVTTNMLFSDMINTYIEKSLSYKLDYKKESDEEWVQLETTSINIPRSEVSSDKTGNFRYYLYKGNFYWLLSPFNILDHLLVYL